MAFPAPVVVCDRPGAQRHPHLALARSPVRGSAGIPASPGPAGRALADIDGADL